MQTVIGHRLQVPYSVFGKPVVVAREIIIVIDGAHKQGAGVGCHEAKSNVNIGKNKTSIITTSSNDRLIRSKSIQRTLRRQMQTAPPQNLTGQAR